MIFADLQSFLLACAVLFVAEVVYVTFGFGAGLIAVGSLALLVPDVRDVVVLLLLVNAPVEAVVVARSRRSVKWRGIALVCTGVAVGIPLGTLLLVRTDPTLVLVILGAVLAVTGLVFLLLPRRGHVDWPRWVALPVGLLSGWLGGTFGTGGPPLILYHQLGGTPKDSFRGELMTVFLFQTILKLPAYAVAGLFTLPRLTSALAVLPAVLLGAWTGHRVHVSLSEERFRQFVSALLVVIGALLLVRALT